MVSGKSSKVSLKYELRTPEATLRASIKLLSFQWFSGDYPTASCVPSLGQDISLAAGSTLHLQSHLEGHDQLQSYQSYHLHHQQQQQQHYPSMTGDFSNYGPIYGSSAYTNYVKCRTNPYQRPSPPPHATSTMPLYYPGKIKTQRVKVG